MSGTDVWYSSSHSAIYQNVYVKIMKPIF